MNRRDFLQSTALLSVPIFLQGIPVFAGDSSLNNLLKNELLATESCEKILVIIQMNGGNDGLNTIIPLDKYAQLNAARSNIVIPAASVLPINGNTTTGFHPSLLGLRNLYNEGKVSVVQGVSYPNPNYSHFQAKDIWFSASNSNQLLNTGWLGRELDLTYPNYPSGYPNTENPDPLAIQIGGSLPLSLQCQKGNMGYNTPSPASFINVATATPAPAPQNDYGNELTFLRMMKDQSNSYTARISSSYNSQATLSSLYNDSPSNSLCDQLKVVARLIGGGLKTQIYIVNHPDTFDTHTGQSSAPTTGVHANALDKLSKAIVAFQNDLTLMGKSQKVVGMTFSEFGRRVMSNASKGTDHGTAAPVIFFGDGINGGVIGNSPALPSTPDPSSQVPMQYDFRQLYASVMQSWLCTSPSDSQSILKGAFSTLPIFGAGSNARMDISPSANFDENYARVAFEVTDNQKYQVFSIERSTDEVHFTEVGVIDNNSDDSFKRHTFLDERVSSKKVYYRIKALTKQDTNVFSKTISLNNGKESQKISVYPNPVTNHTINISFYEQIKGNVEINIYGQSGEKLYYDQVSLAGDNKHQFRVADTFVNYNMYILKVSYGETEITEKLLFV